MKSLRIVILLWCFTSTIALAQEAQFPMVKEFGGIYKIPYATINPEPDLTYNIAIELKMGSSPNEINPGMNNVARLMNLHVLGGAKPGNMNVVVIVHGLATHSVLTDQAYKNKYNVDNPNTPLIQELHKSGVTFIICGQSMLARDVNPEDLADGVEVAISMLTVFTTYQLKGYAALQF